MHRIMGAVCLLVLPTLAGADVWDVQTQNDNSFDSENELIHGSDQVHDLGPLAGPTFDQDWYAFRQSPYSSYEVVVDGTSGDVGQASPATPLVLELRTSSSIVLASDPVGAGFSRTLRFRNDSASHVDSQRILVKSASCTTNCGADDVYRIRAYDTTYAIPRFNNTASQATVLIIQNPTPNTVSATVYFWGAAGNLIYSYAPSLAPKSLHIQSLSAVNPPSYPLANQSGSITLTHNAGYGRLFGKAVALEPAMGYSFDTPMVPIPH